MPVLAIVLNIGLKLMEEIVLIDLYSIQQTSDGGYIVAGETHSFGDEYGDIWVIKLDSSGNISWQKTYGGSNHDYANSIQQTSDGGYVVVGYIIPEIEARLGVLKLDSNGDILWQKTYQAGGNSVGGYLQQTEDGGYILTGQFLP